MVVLKLRKYWNYWLVVSLVIYLLLTTVNSSYALDTTDQRTINFEVNDIFDLEITQTRLYEFPLKLDWVGRYALVRVQGGVLTDRRPTHIDITVTLDNVKVNQTFYRMNGLQKFYSFHSENEYVLWIQPPVRPPVEGLEIVHNLTVEVNYEFVTTPEGTGTINQIIFETFTPPNLEVDNYQPLIPLQDEFSWEISQWSFGTCFFNTCLILSFTETQNVSLIINLEFKGLDLESWQIAIKNGNIEHHIRDLETLEEIMELNPIHSTELALIIDPPQVSESIFVNIKVSVQGKLLPIRDLPNSNNSNSDLKNQKRISEGLILMQLGIVIVPIITFYRLRRPMFNKSQEEEKKCH